MLLELHCHTSRYSSCSVLEPRDAICQVLDKGLQGLVITEHEHLWSQQELDELRRQSEVGDGFVLLAAQEVSTDLGHVLVFGAKESIRGKVALDELRRRLPQAALVWAHPYRHDRQPSDGKLLHPALDAVELFNSNHGPRGNYLALADWHRLKYTATAGSDAHAPETVGLFPTILDHPVEEMTQLVQELRAGRCRPFFKEIPKSGSNVTVTEITIGTKGSDELRQRVVVKRFHRTSRWKRQLQAQETLKQLRDGGFAGSRLRVPRTLEVDDSCRMVIEEGQRGKLLFQLLGHVSTDVGGQYLDLAARWLRQMHELGLQTGQLQTTAKRERRRFHSYLSAFTRTRNPHRGLAERLLSRIAFEEELLLEQEHHRFVQNHGDFHPKNIIIGQDRSHDINTLYVSVIDFDSALLFTPSFDVGYFLAQYRYQLRNSPEVLKALPPHRFLARYLDAAPHTDARLAREVSLFEARGNMSIAAFLIKVGKGESAEMEPLLQRSARLLGL